MALPAPNSERKHATVQILGRTLARNIAAIARMSCQHQRESGYILPILVAHSSENRCSETNILCRGFSDEGADGRKKRVGKTRDQQVIYVFVVS